MDLSIEDKTALFYSQGRSFGEIERELEIPRVYFKRTAQKVLKAWLGLQHLQIAETSIGIRTLGAGLPRPMGYQVTVEYP